MGKYLKIAFCAVLGLVLPTLASAQGAAAEIKGLQSVLDQLYGEMIGMSSQLMGVGRGIAGFGATWYIAYRVWRHIANAEPVDFFPLLRPFAIGMAILLFPSVLGIINGVMKPTVTGTAAMVEGSEKAIALLLKQKEEALKKTDYWQMYVGEDGSGDRDLWYKYTHDNEDPSEEGTFASIGNDVRFAMSKAAYNFRNSVKEWMSEILQLLFQAAALCINTIRTFHLIVLAILGPLVLGISVFDGFHHSLTTWLARYINIFLWLPVANLFGAIIGKIQEQMIKMDIGQIQDTGDTFFSSKDTAYLVFLIIGIVGYFTVPSVANYIVHAGGQNAILQKTTSIFGSTVTSSVSAVSSTVGGAVRSVRNVFGGGGSSKDNSSSSSSSSYYNQKRFTGRP
jgi:conjugative transposon TraJ protein